MIYVNVPTGTTGTIFISPVGNAIPFSTAVTTYTNNIWPSATAGTGGMMMLPVQQAPVQSNPRRVRLNNDADYCDVFIPDGRTVRVFGDGTVEGLVQGRTILDAWDLQRGCSLHLPDGAIVKVSWQGDIEVLDKNAKVLYKPPKERDFNPYLSSSDLVEEFIRYCAGVGITKKEFRDLPLNLFLYWLIVRAAERDKEKADDVLLLLETSVRSVKEIAIHRCRFCGRFLRPVFAKYGVNFCSPEHMQRKMECL